MGVMRVRSNSTVGEDQEGENGCEGFWILCEANVFGSALKTELIEYPCNRGFVEIGRGNVIALEDGAIWVVGTTGGSQGTS